MSTTREFTTRPRVLLVGLGPTTRSALDALVDDFDVMGLVRSGSDEVVAHANELGVNVIGDATVRGVTGVITSGEPDAVVVSSFDRILGPDLIARCPFVNVHYAPLPRGRGRATVNWALINGDEHAWMTIHHLVADLDAGGILAQASVPIGPRATSATLYDELNELQREHLGRAVRSAIAGDPGRPQDEDAATYHCSRVPDDGEIDWRWTTERIDRFVRALQPPVPPAFTWLGLERVDVLAARPAPTTRVYEGRVPGRVVAVGRTGGWVEVLTGDGVLRLERVARHGEDEVEPPSLVGSTRSTFGLSTTDLVAALRGATKPDRS